MFRRQLTTINFTSATLLMLVLFCFAVSAQEQTQTANTQMTSRVTDTAIKERSIKTTPESAPVYTNFMGVELGMPAEEVREKLGNPKDKSEQQDFFVFSDSATAQVFYDKSGKAVAISVDYFGNKSKAPSPEEVLGQAVQARPDGSVHALKRYPEAGYWVAYNRTSGDNPITTVTLQKI